MSWIGGQAKRWWSRAAVALLLTGAVVGAGPAALHRLLAAIELSRASTPWRVLYGLGIPGIGKRTAQQLVTHFGSMQGVVDATPAELVAVEGVGPAAAKALVAFWGVPANRAHLQRLAAAGLQVGP